MKHGGMREIRVATVNSTRRDYLEGRRVAFHIPDLHRGSMCAQQMPAFPDVAIVYIKGVMHCPRRMILRNIQRGEIIEIRFDFWARSYREPYRVKQRLDTIERQRYRMRTAHPRAPSRQGHIQCFPY